MRAESLIGGKLVRAVIYNHLPEVHKNTEHKGKHNDNQCPWCGASDFTEASLYVGSFENHLTGEWIETWLCQGDYDEMMDSESRERIYFCQ